MTVERAHYPQATPIEAYGNGGFRFAGMSHRGSIMALPDGISAWDADTPHTLTPDDFDLLAGTDDRPEILLLGTGPDIAFVDDGVRAHLRGLGIGVDVMSTGAAVRTYNVLLAEDRSVGAALIAVS